jgi:hypothetical protein
MTCGERLWSAACAARRYRLHRGGRANARLWARHVYQTSGFTEEGAMRSAYKLPDESRIDLVPMSLLRPDWTATR